MEKFGLSRLESDSQIAIFGVGCLSEMPFCWKGIGRLFSLILEYKN
jgi:hypothetical protein